MRIINAVLCVALVGLLLLVARQLDNLSALRARVDGFGDSIEALKAESIQIVPMLRQQQGLSGLNFRLLMNVINHAPYRTNELFVLQQARIVKEMTGQ